MVTGLACGLLRFDGLDEPLRLCGTECGPNLRATVRRAHLLAEVIGRERVMIEGQADDRCDGILFPELIPVIQGGGPHFVTGFIGTYTYKLPQRSMRKPGTGWALMQSPVP